MANRNIRDSLGDLEKAVETLARSSCSHSISRSSKLPLEFLKLDRNTERTFYFLNKHGFSTNQRVEVVVILIFGCFIHFNF